MWKTIVYVILTLNLGAISVIAFQSEKRAEGAVIALLALYIAYAFVFPEMSFSFHFPLG